MGEKGKITREKVEQEIHGLSMQSQATYKGVFHKSRVKLEVEYEGEWKSLNGGFVSFKEMIRTIRLIISYVYAENREKNAEREGGKWVDG